MFNRAEIIDQNFSKRIINGDLPQVSLADCDASGLQSHGAFDLFESQVISRHLDLKARKLREKGEGFYTIGSSGHEGNAVFGKLMRLSDLAFCHYRSGAFMIQRSKQLPGATYLYDQLLSQVASSEDPISGGRHKVFGSLPLGVPPQTSTIASHLPKAMGMALGIRKASDLELDGAVPRDAVVSCSFGDASFNHSTAQGAINTSAWMSYQNIPLPLVYICEDNNIGISVPTPRGWVKENMLHKPGIRYYEGDGLNIFQLYKVGAEACEYARTMQKPVFLHVKTVRLMGHAGSDVESSYHSLKKITGIERDDPLIHTATLLLRLGWATPDELISIYETVRSRIDRIAEEAVKRPKLETAVEVMDSLVPAKSDNTWPIAPEPEQRKELFGKQWSLMQEPQQMSRLINWTLMDEMLRLESMVVFGEDVAQKGGVYNVTAGLKQAYGVRRVFNSILDEQSILGTAIGLAHNRFLPVPEIQFLAYVHNAEDQIRGEAATLSFFSQGQYTNPMVIRIPGLAYQKGFGGHFHNDNSLTVFRDIPSLIMVCPSSGREAVGLLRRCLRLAWEEQRVIIFIEPIALYRTRDLLEEDDGLWASSYPGVDFEIPYGEVGVHGNDEQCVIITYGNGYWLSRQAAEDVRTLNNTNVKVIDLRWLAPLPTESLVKALKGAKRILIVDECRKTGSVSEELTTWLVEAGYSQGISRVTATDSFIPLGKASTATLPSRESIYRAAVKHFC